MDPLGPELGVFRIAGRPLLPLCLLPAVATLPMVVRALFRVEDASPAMVALLIAMIPLSVALMIGLLWPLRRVFAVRVHELGVRGHDAYGRRVGVAWAQMGGIAPISLIGLDYLRIATSDPRRTLWLPRFVEEPGTFDRLVEQQAGAGHPLAGAVRGGA